jgi:hypothetical protein
MPVANMQPYRSVDLRVRSTAFASQGLAMYLENAVLQKLQQRCSFERVSRPGTTPGDVILDLNITQTGRGGGGFISNSNVATIDTLLVLSDGASGDLLGTARIQGKSSGVIINNSQPETEAIDAVAKAVTDMLAKSGCSGPRIAKEEPPPPPPPPTNGEGSGTAPDPEKLAQADALNEQGKEKLRAADIAGALALFQQAVALAPDPRYQYNVCLALGGQEQWDQAIAACNQAKTMNPDSRLAAKIDHRIELLQNHQ